MSYQATTTNWSLTRTACLVILFVSAIHTTGCGDKPVEVPVAFSDEGVLVYRLGKDTIGYQHFLIKADTVTLRTIYLPGGYSYSVTDALMSSEGTIRKSETVFHKKDGEWQLQESGARKKYPAGDDVDAKGKNKAGPTFAAGGPFAVSDAGPVTDYFFAAMPHYFKGDGKVAGAQLAFRELRPFAIQRAYPTMVYVSGDFIGHVTLVIDSADRLLSVEATRSPLGVTANVYRSLSFDSLLTATRLRPDLDSMPPLSPVSKVISHFPELDVMLNYSKPSARGRKVLGKLIPYRETWRMGANRSTEITFSEPVYFNKHPLKPGTYSLFALFTNDAGTLTINHQSGIWGTDHDATWDGERIPFRISRLAEPREQLDMRVMRVKPGHFVLQVEWDRLQAIADFSMEPVQGKGD